MLTVSSAPEPLLAEIKRVAAERKCTQLLVLNRCAGVVTPYIAELNSDRMFHAYDEQVLAAFLPANVSPAELGLHIAAWLAQARKHFNAHTGDVFLVLPFASVKLREEKKP